MPPRYDTREGAIILKQIAERLGVGQYFPYETMDELVAWQLEGTGFTTADFDKKGFVAYGKDQIFWDRAEGIKIKTPSGKIEFKSSLLENAGFESFPAYESMPGPQSEDAFRLVVGRNALHTHVSTQNVAYLNEICPENVAWINSARAKALGIKDRDTVEITSSVGSGRMQVYVSDMIHPEALFILHGFGHTAGRAARSFNRGVNDCMLQENLYDKVGGSPAYHDTFVSVRRV